jgi:uncharacterized alkaline shock family protein YloU
MTSILRTPEGEISVAPAALQQIVVRAAESVDGARVRRPKRSVEVRIAEGRCRVSLELEARYGTPLAELAEDVQRCVTAAVSGMLELDVDAVDVTIEDLAEW